MVENRYYSSAQCALPLSGFVGGFWSIHFAVSRTWRCRRGKYPLITVYDARVPFTKVREFLKSVWKILLFGCRFGRKCLRWRDVKSGARSRSNVSKVSPSHFPKLQVMAWHAAPWRLWALKILEICHLTPMQVNRTDERKGWNSFLYD